MKRFDIINMLIQRFEYKHYLEIGVRDKSTFNKIVCKNKSSVDPKHNPTYKMTSTHFFKINEKRFDIIFIDGLHQEHQVDIDIRESLKILNEGGCIVVHDCNPTTKERAAEVQPRPGHWNGTVWKSFVKLRFTNDSLKMCTVNTDFGCGIIKKGNQKILNEKAYKQYLTFNIFAKNRKKFLNLISPEEFSQRVEIGNI